MQPQDPQAASTDAQQQQQQHLPAAPVRWSWNQFPQTRIDATRMVIPLGCLYSPLSVPAIALPYEPLKCNCGAILNAECQVDFRSKSWLCPVCLHRNAFPPSYATMGEADLPAELRKEYSVVEYVKHAPERPAATFVIVIDTCVSTESELEHMRSTVLRAITQLPETMRVAVITFGTTVQLHDLSGSDFPRSLVFRGSAELTTEAIKRLVKNPSRYVAPLSDVEFSVTSLIEDLVLDCWPVAKEQRARRCTGAALSAAASLLELVSPKSGSAILSFLSGACTEGPGTIVSCPKEDMLRTHNDLRDKKAPLYDPACTFYEGLMRRMVANGHALHVISASLDQVGLAEMRGCIQASGGVLIATDLWKRGQLKSSIDRFFDRDSEGNLAMGLNVTLDVHTSPNWKVTGLIGQLIGTGKRSASVAETEVGLGGTCQWTSSYIDSRTTYAAYFEPATVPPTQPAPDKGSRVVQFVLRYQQGLTDRTRVITVRHACTPERVDFRALRTAFDQEAAAVLLARIAVHKTESGAQHVDVLRWIDRHLIRLVSRFGDYEKDNASSVRLDPAFSNFPLFLFHLRRSAYVHVFNNSPDETANLRILLLKVGAADAIVMIHPTLYSYSMSAAPTAVPLDSGSLRRDTSLLLDTFFEVLIHHGEMISAWRKQGYEEDPQYEHFKSFLAVPRADALALAAKRFPAPRLIECGEGDGDGRILKNRINPSLTHNSTPGAGMQYGQGTENSGELVYTDDVNLQAFTDHLKRLAVQPQP